MVGEDGGQPGPRPGRQAATDDRRPGQHPGGVAQRRQQRRPPAGQPDDGAGDDHDDGDRRGEVTQVRGALVLAHHHPAPAAVVAVLTGQRPQRGPGPVGHAQPGREPHQPAAVPDPVVELPVLGPQEGLVVAAEPLQHLAAEHPEVDRVGRALLAADVEAGLADADRAGHRDRDGPLEVGDALGGHQAADVVGAGLAAASRRRPGRSRPAAARGRRRRTTTSCRAVAIARLSPCRVRAGRVGHQPDPRVVGRELGRDLVGAVAGRARAPARPRARRGSPARARWRPPRGGGTSSSSTA